MHGCLGSYNFHYFDVICYERVKGAIFFQSKTRKELLREREKPVRIKSKWFFFILEKFLKIVIVIDSGR